MRTGSLELVRGTRFTNDRNVAPLVAEIAAILRKAPIVGYKHKMRNMLLLKTAPGVSPHQSIGCLFPASMHARL